MPSPKPPVVEITPRVQGLLEHLVRQQTTEYRLVRRAQLIVAMAAGIKNGTLARTKHLNRATVRYWRARWLALTPRLVEAEAAQASDTDLLALLRTGLTDHPRPGAPVTFTAEQVVQIIAVACEAPQACGRPVSHWTPPELAEEVTKRAIVPQISPSSVRRFLKSGRPPAPSDRVLAQPHPGRSGGVCYPSDASV